MKNYLSIKDASEFLGLSKETLRNYQKKKILIPEYINPFTKYRYYTIEQLEEFLKKFSTPSASEQEPSE